MSETAVPSTTTFIFIIRFWRETSAGEVRWRGRIEHVQSGRQANFLDVDELVAFLNRFGIGAHPRSTKDVLSKDNVGDA